uniref:G-protein coupled receptors family 1 profile domain-containing protein n=2 Tax=Latimeria chalumnae TaxID=7897 RepID=H3AGL7_LATCH
MGNCLNMSGDAEDIVSIDSTQLQMLFSDVGANYSDSLAVSAPCDSICWPALSALAPIFHMLLFFFTVGGNSVLVCSLVTSKATYQPRFLLLVQISLWNILSVLPLPFNAMTYHSEWMFGVIFCQVTQGVKCAAYSGAGLLMACLALTHFFLRPERWTLLLTALSLLAWIASILLGLMQALVSEVSGWECFLNPAEDHVHWLSFTLPPLSSFFVPFLLTLATLCIARCRDGSARALESGRAWAVIILLFFLLWLPAQAALVAELLVKAGALSLDCTLQRHLNLLSKVAEALGMLHSCVNPFVVAVM